MTLENLEPEVLNRVLSQIPEGIVLVSNDGAIVAWNGRFETMFGLGEDARSGVVWDLVIDTHQKYLSEALDDLGKDEGGPGEVVMKLLAKRSDGETVPTEARVFSVGGAERSLSCIVFRDISRRQKLTSELRRLARKDRVTGLLSGPYFLEIFQRELERTTRYRHPVSILLLELHHLEPDLTIHSQRDEAALLRVADIGRRVLRTADVFARISAGTFGIILPETPGDSCELVAQRLLSGFLDGPEESEVKSLEGESSQVEESSAASYTSDLHLSIGFASLRVDDPEAELLWERVKKAVEEARSQGGNRAEGR
jgi:PAS domain S-box-containing protein/diguanylate cyclase (GGDEF)-like protein